MHTELNTADHGHDENMSIFRPPVIRSTAALNRALFSKTFNLAAAKVNDNRDISRFRQSLSKSGEILKLERISPIINDPSPVSGQGQTPRKCLILRPGTSASDPGTWGDIVKEGVEQEKLGVVPCELTLDYDYWSSRDVLESLLPEEFHDDIPTSFNTAGHVAHFNLREQSLPYKHLVAEVILDKNPHIKTVINKTDNVGTESQFRTFAYEVLCGPDDMDVEVRENSCVYKFDYSKVYWNSKLEGEHTRLTKLFKPGEVVCDVMAGIGPFAVPAGKGGVFVWANDMNPESFHYLKDSISRNKVSQFVRPFNEDGAVFIRQAADAVLEASSKGACAVVEAKFKYSRTNPQPRPPPKRIAIPPTISHFVMNLPASAISFLPRYQGLYAGQEALFAPTGGVKLPLIHVHCFAVKSDDDLPKLDICERVSKELGVEMKLGDQEKETEVAVHLVRHVAPNKSMFCASFRLPREVAFAKR